MFLESASAVPQSIVITHLTTAGIAVAAIQWLKKSRYFPWITQGKGRLCRLAAILTSAIGAVGINYAWNPAGRELVFHIPTFTQGLGIGIAWAKSFVTQEIIYQGTTKNGISEVLNLLRALASAQGITPTTSSDRAARIDATPPAKP